MLKTVLITGAAHRIGRAIAERLSRDTWGVAIHVRSSRRAGDALADEIRQAGGRAAVVQADLTDVRATLALVDEAAATLGPLTCLVNNASEFLFDTLDTLTPEQWARHIDVNLRAPVLLAGAFARQLPAEAQGLVINLIDQRVLRPSPDFFSYAVSKAALWDATRMMAQALAPRVRVNAVAPGPTLASIHQCPADFEAERRSTLLGRGTSPAEIAAAVSFLLDAPAITGQMLALDAGQHLTFEGAERFQSALSGGRAAANE
jgi:NAD(P)-dependent dehydrogenase (short-subunit alcohol dehydrogenase family)